jgi:hypothetical protein
MCCRRGRCWDDILSCGRYTCGGFEGRGFPLTRVQDAARAEHALNRPGVLGPPSGLPVITQAIPKFTPTRSTGAMGPEGLGRIKGMTLPRQAERPLTPFMRQQIRVHRQLQGPFRIETRPEFRPLARPETAPPVEVIRGVTSRKFTPSGAGEFQPAPGATTPEVIRGATSRKFHPPGSGGFQFAPSREFRQPAGGPGRCHLGISPTSAGRRARNFRLRPRCPGRNLATVNQTMSLAPRGTPPTRRFPPSQRREGGDFPPLGGLSRMSLTMHPATNSNPAF